MELGEVVPDVFVLAVAEQLQLGAVGPQDRAVGPDAVQAFDRVLQEVGELLLALAQHLLGGLALGDLRLERRGSLLQRGDRVAGMAVIRANVAKPSAGRTRACAAHTSRKAAACAVLAKTFIGYAQNSANAVLLHQRIPQAARACTAAVVLAVGAQQRDHLAESAHAATTVAGCARNDVTDDLAEAAARRASHRP